MVVKKLFLFCLFSIFTASAMEMHFVVEKNCSSEEKNNYYDNLRVYLASAEGKEVALYPDRGIFEFPSYYTYILHLAISLDDVVMVKKLLQKYGKKIVAGIAYEGRTLQHALRNNNKEIIELIRTRGTNFIKLANGCSLILNTRLSQKEIDKYRTELPSINSSKIYHF